MGRKEERYTFEAFFLAGNLQCDGAFGDQCHDFIVAVRLLPAALPVKKG